MIKKIFCQTQYGDDSLVIGIEPGYKKVDIVKISQKENNWPVISFHNTEGIAFAFITQRNSFNKREIYGIPHSLTDKYFHHLKEEREVLNRWAQNKKRKEPTLNWLITHLHQNRVHNLAWLSSMRMANSEEYWEEVAEKAGIVEKLEKHQQYISYSSNEGNVFLLYALEYGIKHEIYMPFNPREVPLPHTKEICIIKL